MTMEIHHGRHHKAYVDNLNKALESAPDLQNKSIEDLLRGIKSLPAAFGLGASIGIIPVLMNQQHVAGAWYLPTYASVDAAPPTLGPLSFNLSYFLGNGPASVDNWALLAALIGLIGFVMLYLQRDFETQNRLGLTWKRFALALFLLWFISIGYFLTHWTIAAHYMISSIFATVTLLGFGIFGIEAMSEEVQRFNPRKAVSWVALVLILWPAVTTFQRVWTSRAMGPAPQRAVTHQPILLPSELMDDKAWIWADLLTGSLWYYSGKPAFKIQVTDEETRARIFRWVFERGERQYLIQDSEQMEECIEEEIKQLGGKLEMRGKVDGQPYFLIIWPAGGPQQGTPPQGTQST